MMQWIRKFNIKSNRKLQKIIEKYFIIIQRKLKTKKIDWWKKAIGLLNINILIINSKKFSDSSSTNNNNNSINKISKIHQYNKSYLKIKIKLLM